MGNKLQQGDRLPPVTLKLVTGRTLELPEAMLSRYVAFLVYRGHW